MRKYDHCAKRRVFSVKCGRGYSCHWTLKGQVPRSVKIRSTVLRLLLADKECPTWQRGAFCSFLQLFEAFFLRM
jgi:hypothetical protein